MASYTPDGLQQENSVQSTRPILLSVRSSKVFILVVVATAVFTDTFFYTLIIPILPNLLEERAGISPQHAQQWISTLLSTYALMNLITSSLAGWLMDRAGSRKPALLGGLVVMAISTTLFAFGRTPALLLIARGLQGMSAAVIRVGGLALITDTFEPGKSGSAMGWQSIGMFLGTFTGPSLSGLLYEKFGFSAVFGLCFAVLSLDMVLRLVMVERKEALKWAETMEPSQIDESSSLIPRSEESRLESGQYVPSSTGENSSDSTASAPKSAPIFALLKDRRLLTALWATFSCAVVMTALESVVPLYTMNLFSWTPAQTGILIVALAISIVADPLYGSLADKYGSRWLSVAGFVVVTLVYSLATLILHDTHQAKVGIWLLLILLGFAIGAISTPNTVEISLLTSAAEKEGRLGGFRADQVMGQAYGMLSVAYQLGSLVGPAWGGLVLVTQGWIVMSATFAVLAGVSVLIMFRFAGAR